MPSNLKDKVQKMQFRKNIKETGSALVSDVKEIAKDSKDAASDALDHVKNYAKDAVQKVDKKLP